MRLASSEPISRMNRLRQRISPPWVCNSSGPFGRHWGLAVVVILEQGMVHHQLLVQPNADARADHDHVDTIPLAKRLVRQHQRVFAGGAGAVVPQSARPFVRAEREFGLFGVVPDLHLRAAAQIDARIRQRHGLVLDQQLEIAVVLLRGGVSPLAVVDEFAILDGPVRLHGRIPLSDLVGAGLRGHARELARVERLSSPPPA